MSTPAPIGVALGITIHGEVREDEEGELLEGVRVRLARAPSPTRETHLEKERPARWFLPHPVTDVVEERVTGADGSFSFTVPSLREWVILAGKDGYGEAVHATSAWDADPETRSTELEIVLQRARRLRLQVVDESDRPVSGATVTQYDRFLDQPPVAVLRTDEEGFFELPVTDRDQLVVRADGFGRVVEYGLLDRDGAPIVLPEAYAVGGTVVDGAGRPIEGAVVWTDYDAMPLRITGTDGSFRWDDVAWEHNRTFLEISARALGTLRGRERAAPGQTDIRMVLSEPGVVTGRIVFPSGFASRPVELGIDGPQNFHCRVSTEGSEFRAEGVPYGRLRLEVVVHRSVRVGGQDHPVFALRGRTEVERPPGVDLHGVEVRLEPVVVSYVVARVVDPNGRPLAGAGLDVDAPWGGGGAKRSDTEGRIWKAIASVPGTATTLAAWSIVRVHDGTRSVRSPAVDARTVADPESAPVEVVLDLEPARQLEQTRLTLVMEREDGVPIPPDAAVSWHVWQHWPRYDGRNPAVTGPDASGGSWRGELLVEAGLPIHIKAWAKGCANRRFDLPAPTAGEIHFVCRMKAESRVRGRLVTHTGRPARQYKVRANVRPPGEPAVMSTLHEDAIGPDGRFVLGGVPAGHVHVSVLRGQEAVVAQATGRVGEGQTLDVGDLVIGTLPRLRGSVRDEAGRALGGVLVELLDRERQQPYLQGSTRGDGTFDFAAPLRAGSVVRFRRDDFAPRYLALTQALFDEPQDVCLFVPGTLILECGAPPDGVAIQWVTAFEETCGYCLGSLGSGHLGRGRLWRAAELPVGPVRLVLLGTRIDGTRWEVEVRSHVVSGGETAARFVWEE